MLLEAAMEELQGSADCTMALDFPAFRQQTEHAVEKFAIATQQYQKTHTKNTLQTVLNEEVPLLRRSTTKPINAANHRYNRQYDSSYKSSTIANLYGSPAPSSPYYFSPLSYTTSNDSHEYFIPSPARSPAARGRTSDVNSTVSVNTLIHQPHRIRAKIESSRSILTSANEISDSSSTTSSTDSSDSSLSTPDGNAILANCLLSITSMADDQPAADQPMKKESMAYEPPSCIIKSNNNADNLSFASPELQIQIDEQCPAAQETDHKSSMLDFINRGGPGLMRSFSLRNTYSEIKSNPSKLDNSTDSPSHLRKYYSSRFRRDGNYSHGSLPKLEQSSSESPLEKLFPLKRPQHSRLSQSIASSCYQSAADGDSPVDESLYMDALNRSLDSLVERPAGQEVVIETINDQNIDFAYSPVASAFVFSPRRSAQNSPIRKPRTCSAADTSVPPSHLSRSVSAKVYSSSNNNRPSDQNIHLTQPPKSILKKPFLPRDAAVNGLRSSYSMCDRISNINPLINPGVNDSSSELDVDVDVEFVDDFGWHPAKDIIGRRRFQRIDSNCSSEPASPKISSVLLKYAEEAEEHFYDSRQRPPSSATCLPMRSFFGRAFLCRSKLGSSGQFPGQM